MKSWIRSQFASNSTDEGGVLHSIGMKVFQNRTLLHFTGCAPRLLLKAPPATGKEKGCATQQIDLCCGVVVFRCFCGWFLEPSIIAYEVFIISVLVVRRMRLIG
jgi:hypothetical protein